MALTASVANAQYNVNPSTGDINFNDFNVGNVADIYKLHNEHNALIKDVYHRSNAVTVSSIASHAYAEEVGTMAVGFGLGNSGGINAGAINVDSRLSEKVHLNLHTTSTSGAALGNDLASGVGLTFKL